MPAASRAILPDFPDREFAAQYWPVPDGPTIYAYVSRVIPIMVAIDLHDARNDAALQGVVVQMRGQQPPFRGARDVRAGQHRRFLVATIEP